MKLSSFSFVPHSHTFEKKFCLECTPTLSLEKSSHLAQFKYHSLHKTSNIPQIHLAHLVTLYPLHKNWGWCLWEFNKCCLNFEGVYLCFSETTVIRHWKRVKTISIFHSFKCGYVINVYVNQKYHLIYIYKHTKSRITKPGEV